MFPRAEPALLQCVAGEHGIVVRTSFPFSPPVSFKDRYGPFPVAKIRRIAEHWRGRTQVPPPDIAAAITAYERDHSVYEAQYQAAWQELMQQRLPTPPQGYY